MASFSGSSSSMSYGSKADRGSSKKSGSTLQKIALKKEQLRLYPRIKKIERIATHLGCEVSVMNCLVCSILVCVGKCPWYNILIISDELCMCFLKFVVQRRLVMIFEF